VTAAPEDSKAQASGVFTNAAPVPGSGPQDPDRPPAWQEDEYAPTSIAASFEDRRQAFFDFALGCPPEGGFKAPFYELVRLHQGQTPDEAVFQASLDYIAERKDCSDFILHAILRLLYQFSDHPEVSPGLLERSRQVVLEFKYWPDEPGLDSMCTWTENHQVLFSSAAYLAGQLFPDAVFTNDGQTGRQKMAVHRPRIMRWLDLRFRTGFSEWLSHVYYDEDLTALASLVDFCQDQELSSRSEMIIDLVLADMALHSYRGIFGSTHGRSYEPAKKRSSREGTASTHKLFFGTGNFSNADNMSAACLALSPRYRLPQVLYVIANDAEQPEKIIRQRMGIRLEEAARWGLGFDSLEDGMVYLSLEAYTHPRTIPLVMRMFDSYNWWQNSFFAPFRPYRRYLNALRRLHLLPALARLVEKDVTRNTRTEVNIYTYRTPDGMLSSAQDHRPGYGGDQQHAWQATLAPGAVCFTSHPARHSDASPGYWTGSGSLPRVGQVKNVLVAIYDIDTSPGLYLTHRMLFTHAWLPREHFDQVVEREGWIFARKGKGFLALRSQNPYHWQEEEGEDQGREVIAPGKRNVWICEIGREAVDGPFDDYISRIAAAPLKFGDRSTAYQSPSVGLVEFAWKGPLRVNGEVFPLSDYPRYDSPYGGGHFPAEEIHFRYGDQRLTLDWANLSRKASRYA
jgi:hypothetical protein